MLLHWLWYRFFLPESDVDQRKSQLERQTQPQRFNPFQPQFPQFGMFLQFNFNLTTTGITAVLKIYATDVNLIQWQHCDKYPLFIGCQFCYRLDHQ